MPESRTGRLRNALLSSATRRSHLAFGGAAVLFSITTSLADWGGQLLPSIVLGFGLLAYAGMVAIDLANPAFIRRSNEVNGSSAATQMQLVSPSALSDPELRSVYAGIISSLGRCRGLYDVSNDGLRAGLADGIRRAEELGEIASRTAQRSEAIRRHLLSDSPDGIGAELRRLDELSARSADETAKRDFAQAAAAKSKELETYRQLEALYERHHAQLRLIETSLDGLSAKLVKLDATDIAEAIQINEALTDNLRTMSSDVEVLESTYEETMQEFRA